MATLTQCTLCEKRPMEPYQTNGGTYYKCSYCDSADVGVRPREEMLPEE